MLIPYSVDVPMERWPYANWALIALTSIISLAILGGAGRQPLSVAERDQLEDQLAQAEDPADIKRLEDRLDRAFDLIPPLALRPHDFSILQLFSCLFVHGDLLHLVGNMIFLFVFGNAVNAKLGHAPFVIAYLLLGAVASCAWLALGNGMPAVGASGAIMGIMGLFLVLYPHNDITILYFFSIAFSGTFALSSYWVILAYLGSDLFATIRGHNAGVAYVAHLGGAFGGIAMALTALVLGYFAPTRYEKNLLQMLGVESEKPQRKRKKRKAPRPRDEDVEPPQRVQDEGWG